MSTANYLNLDLSKELSSGTGLTLYYTIPTFNDPQGEHFLKNFEKWKKC